jgi:hypothetical protein
MSHSSWYLRFFLQKLKFYSRLNATWNSD